MLPSLVATCTIIVIFVGILIALKIVVEGLRLLTDRWVPEPAGSHWRSAPLAHAPSRAPLAYYRREDRNEQLRMAAAGHDARHAPKSTEARLGPPRSAKILPFARKPVRRRLAQQDGLSPDAA
jgi:hypothetical protein